MSNLSFCFESNQVRTLGDALNPLFVALDICKALGFKNPWDALKQHVDPEDLCKQEIIDSMNRKQEVNCVNESGMYALIFGSKLPCAKRFKRWVTSEVLPQIRKNGQFTVTSDDALSELISPSQQLEIREAIAKRCKDSGKHYQTYYMALYSRFKIARYDQLPAICFKEALDFIRDVDLSVPTVSMADNGMPVSKTEAENLLYLEKLGTHSGKLASQLIVTIKKLYIQQRAFERQFHEMKESLDELQALQNELHLSREMTLTTSILNPFFERFKTIILR